MVIFFFTLLVFQLYVYLKVDYKIYGTYYTPTIILTLPYVGVLFTYIALHNYLEFKDISGTSVFTWNIGTFIFWMSGLLTAKLSLKKIIKKPFKKVRGIDIPIKGLHSLVLLITYFFIAILILSFFKNVKILGIDSLGSEEFASKFAGGGLFGHSLNVLRYLLVYLIIKTSLRSYQTNTAILIIIIFNLLYMVKGWLFIPLLAGLLVRILFIGDIKLSISFKTLKRVVIFILFTFSIFAGFYYLNLGREVPFKFIFVHFFHYLWSGIIGFSEYLNSDLMIGGNTSKLFNPLINIFNKITGNDMQSFLRFDLFNSYLGGYYKGTNVSTIFGTIYIFTGPLLFPLIIIFFSFLIHFIFVWFINSKLVFSLVLYSLFFIALFFGWFDIYLNHLFFYIIIVLTIMFNILIINIKKN